MTYERAFYHKLMVEVGLYESFDKELDALLKEEDPLNSLTLDLALCGSDYNQVLSVLNEFLRNVAEDDIDYNVVLDYILEDIRRLYTDKTKSVEELVVLMNSIAWNSGRWDGEFSDMSLMWDLYVERDYYVMRDFVKDFEDYIFHKKLWYGSIAEQPKQSFFSKLIAKFKRKK